MSLKKNQFDVAIIGAGISGLVCGCYLSKNGKKVLLVEKESHVGGYCTSFRKHNACFDACVHSLESFRPGGYLDSLFIDLQINRDTLFRANPSNVFMTPRYKFRIWNNVSSTIHELQEMFPCESKNILKFIQLFLLDISIPKLFRLLAGRSYEDLLNEYFRSYDLKAILKLFLGCLCEPSYRVSAFTAILNMREYVFDNGYYFSDGIKAFSELLVETFRKNGGSLMLNREVTQIILNRGTVKGIILESNDRISAKVVISACDANKTFLDYIGRKHLGSDAIIKFNKLEISKSAFVVYLIFNRNIYDGESFHYSNSNDVDLVFSERNHISRSGMYLIYFSPSKYSQKKGQTHQSVVLLSNVPYISEKFWKINKEGYGELIIRCFEKAVGKSLKKYITFKSFAPPIELNRITNNTNGAFRGWAPIKSQDRIRIPFYNKFKGLYTTGHWSLDTGRGGIPMVVYSGKTLSQRILSLEK